MKREKEPMGWISVEEKKPEDDQNVFCWFSKNEDAIPLICYYDANIDEFIPIFCQQICFAKVTYWMPLPRKPNRESPRNG